MITPEAFAQMPPAQQALYASRPSWAVAATAIAVWFGAAGSLGLVLRKRWAKELLLASLLGVIVQDLALFKMSGAIREMGPAAIALQGFVLVVASLLVALSRTAIACGWIDGGAAR